MKRFLHHFTWTVIIGVLFYLGIKYQIHLEEEFRITYELMPSLIFATIFPIATGISLRLPHLIVEIKEKKQWTFDWVKVVAIALPALYITTFPLLSFTSFGMNLLFANEIIFFSSPTFTTVAGIVFGYVLLDSLKK